MIGTLISAWLDVQSKPLRTLAAIAGMVAAIVAVIIVSAADQISREANGEYLARQYGKPITMSIMTDEQDIGPAVEQELADRLMGAGFLALSPDRSISLSRAGSSQGQGFDAAWVSSAYRDIRVIDMVAGTWPTDTATALTTHVVVSSRWAQDLGFQGGELIGQAVMVRITADNGDPRLTRTFPVIIDGVAANSSNAFESPQILLVSDLRNPFFASTNFPLAWLVRVNPRDAAALSEIIRTVVDKSGQPLYRMQRDDQLDALGPVLDQQEVTGRAVALIALLIGGLGILGVGVASVRERSREFGVRRALGASRIRIFVGVVVQSLLEVLLAAVVAVPLAAILLELYARDLVLDTLPLPSNITLPLGSVGVGVGSALLVGLIASLLPATTAARANVIQVLRG